MSREHNYGLDLLRILAMFAVVVIHTPTVKGSCAGPSILNFLPPANPTFAFLAGWFMCLRAKNISEWLAKRSKRLLLIYCVWEFLYLLWEIGRDLLFQGDFNFLKPENWISNIFFGATGGQMWFIIFLFYAQCFVAMLYYCLCRCNDKWFYPIVLVLAFGLGLGFDYIPIKEGRQFAFMAGYLSLGLIMARICNLALFRKGRNLCAPMCLLIVAMSFFLPINGMLRTLAWVGLFANLSLPGRPIEFVARTCLGIYLVHHMVPERLLHMVLPWIHDTLISNDGLLVFSTALFMFVVSFVAVKIGQRSKNFAWIFG